MAQQLPLALPLDLSSFVGREREIAQITPLIVAHRLVTLTGAGGSGKTRLGLEIAARLAAEFADGVRLVELAPLTDASLLVEAVAHALGLSDPVTQITVERLAHYLEQRELLLILDNCEHLISACAEFAHSLLRRCCLDLRVLATSREPLGVVGEVVWRVPPLSLPGSTEEIGASDAVRLFVERAHAVSPGFALNDQNASTVADICRRLDGMPLAIELAAASLRILTPQQIVARLGGALDLLRGNRGVIPRHRTMRAAIEWSYRLLDAPAASALRHLSVFHGGCALDAAAAVCALPVFEALDLLTELVDKSLVIAEPVAGEMRYRLLEVIRQYAGEQLEESGEADEARRRHLAHYLALSGAATPALRSPQLLETLDWLDREQDNFRAAMSYALAHVSGASCHAEQGLRLASGLAMYWRVRSNFGEGRDWLTKGLEAVGDHGAGQARAAGLMHAGLLAILQAGTPAGLPFLVESLALWKSLEPPDEAGLAQCLWRIGMAEFFRSNFVEARPALEAALALFREAQDPLGVADTVWQLGASWVGEDDQRAQALIEEGLALYQQAGDVFMAHRPRAALAELTESRRDYERASQLYELCVADSRQLRHQFGESFALFRLGWVCLKLGETGAALEHLTRSLQLEQQLGLVPSFATFGIGYVLLATGQAREAFPLFCGWLEGFTGSGDDTGVAGGLVALANTHAALGEPRRAAQLLAAAVAVCERADLQLHWSDKPEFERALEAVRRGLTKAVLDAAWAEGIRMSLQEAMALATRPGGNGAGPGAEAGPLKTPLQAAKARYGGLTAREREVAAWVARGISNREIAELLVVSERTVEAHIGNILGKLHLSSRTQIATWALEKGLVSRDRKNNRDF
jgi:predicted ATPase/DNA-binding CsgD family transcriptional regulator